MERCRSDHVQKEVRHIYIYTYPNTQCMVCLPQFGSSLWYMKLHIQYIESLG